MQLDDLVLHKCAENLHFIDRIYFDCVSRQFADAVEVVNKRQKIWLSIEPDTNKTAHNFNKDIFFLCLRCRCQNINDSDYAGPKRNYRLYKNQIRERLMHIFFRFSRYHCLKINAKNSAFIMDTLLDVIERYPPMKLRRLIFVVDYNDNDGTREQTDCRLIASLSQVLKELEIHCLVPMENESSFNLWTTVSSCANLRSLEYDPVGQEANETRSHIQFCLQKLSRIRDLDFNFCFKKADDVKWLMDTCKFIPTLRALFVISADDLANASDSHSFLPLLCSAGGNGYKFCGRGGKETCETFDEFSDLPLQKIQHLTENPTAGNDLLRDITATIRLWLAISGHLGKKITICASINSFSRGDNIEKVQAIKELSGAEKFSCAKIEWIDESSCVLQWENAQLIVGINFLEK